MAGCGIELFSVVSRTHMGPNIDLERGPPSGGWFPTIKYYPLPTRNITYFVSGDSLNPARQSAAKQPARQAARQQGKQPSNQPGKQPSNQPGWLWWLVTAGGWLRWLAAESSCFLLCRVLRCERKSIRKGDPSSRGGPCNIILSITESEYYRFSAGDSLIPSGQTFKGWFQGTEIIITHFRPKLIILRSRNG